MYQSLALVTVSVVTVQFSPDALTAALSCPRHWPWPQVTPVFSKQLVRIHVCWSDLKKLMLYLVIRKLLRIFEKLTYVNLLSSGEIYEL